MRRSIGPVTSPGGGPSGHEQRRRTSGPGVPVGRFLGVPIYFAPSWFLIAFIITITYASLFDDVIDDLGASGSYLVALLFAVLLAASVLVHELGHVAVSVALGLPVRRVVIFLLGGVSEIIREPRRARDEFLIAAAGPLVSLVIAGACRLAVIPTDSGSVTSALLSLLFWTNLGLAVFNLLPGLPLDGGRVLRSGIWGLFRSKSTGTKVAAWAGRVLAVALLIAVLALVWYDSTDGSGVRDGFGSLTSVLVTGLVAVFIWSGATASLRALRIQERTADFQIAPLLRAAQIVPADLPVSELAALLTGPAGTSGPVGIIVVDGNGQPRGVVDGRRIDAVPERQRPWVSVSEVASALDPQAYLTETMDGAAVLAAVRAHPTREYVVITGDGSIVGTVLAEDIGKALVARN